MRCMIFAATPAEATPSDESSGQEAWPSLIGTMPYEYGEILPIKSS